MKEFTHISFNVADCRKELRKFQRLLNSSDELSEQRDLLPFFRKNPSLCALIGQLHPMLMVPDLVAHEYDLFGDFTCDLVIGDSVRQTFCFVEFEDAKKDSIFQKTSGRATSKWSNRFEQGFSQIVDWMYKLADMEKSDAFETRFGTRSIDFMGVLIIGRDQYLSSSENRRLKWREKFVLINSQRVHCLTFDELLQVLENKLTRLPHSSYNQRRGC